MRAARAIRRVALPDVPHAHFAWPAQPLSVPTSTAAVPSVHEETDSLRDQMLLASFANLLSLWDCTWLEEMQPLLPRSEGFLTVLSDTPRQNASIPGASAVGDV